MFMPSERARHDGSVDWPEDWEARSRADGCSVVVEDLWPHGPKLRRSNRPFAPSPLAQDRSEANVRLVGLGRVRAPDPDLREAGRPDSLHQAELVAVDIGERNRSKASVPTAVETGGAKSKQLADGGVG